MLATNSPEPAVTPMAGHTVGRRGNLIMSAETVGEDEGTVGSGAQKKSRALRLLVATFSETLTLSGRGVCLTLPLPYPGDTC